MSEFGQGLSLSGIGILITFSALGILILLILILKALFPTRGDGHEVSRPAEIPPTATDLDREELRKKAAAAGVVVLLSNRSIARKSRLGSELEKPVGKWWQRGLDRIHDKERL